jgi:hypothetical protein
MAWDESGDLRADQKNATGCALWTCIRSEERAWPIVLPDGSVAKTFRCNIRRTRYLFSLCLMTPLAIGDRKALKELNNARAMTTVFARRSEDLRARGDALIREADKLLWESWNEWSDGEPIDSVAGGRPSDQWLDRCGPRAHVLGVGVAGGISLGATVRNRSAGESAAMSAAKGDESTAASPKP